MDVCSDLYARGSQSVILNTCPKQLTIQPRKESETCICYFIGSRSLKEFKNRAEVTAEANMFLVCFIPQHLTMKNKSVLLVVFCTSQHASEKTAM